ncbi:response regulator [Paenibacillus lautus]|jgi:CheY-like chemotaxis protein|uniref:response regulator n=1 Tax=Paenibacillus lautus TaxID=1401 RepID=UPI0010D2E33C|nr:response regulator [Paenibacillus lautus]MCI1774629.1 response regulator [Paenibacillus lautus]VTR37141.1 sensor histidine kinase [Actinobacillus pleuropneumoniae]
MKLKSKLVIGFTTLLALMLVLTLIGYDRISYMNNQMDQIYQERYQKVRNSSGMRGEVNNMARELTNMILSNDPSTYTVSKQEIENMTAQAEEYFRLIKESVNTAEEQQLLVRIERAVNEYIVYQNKTLELLSTSDADGANALRNSTGQSVQEEMLISLNELSSYENQKINDDIAAAKAAYDRSVQMFIYIMAGGLLIGMLVILWILPSITRGINVVSMMLKSFGEGRLKAIRRIKVTSKDEFGDVARVFKDLSEDIIEKQRIEETYLQAQRDQSWLNSNMARVTELLEGINSLEEVGQRFISEFTPILGAHYGAIYIRQEDKHPNKLEMKGSYAHEGGEEPKVAFMIGEGLVGQAALDKKPVVLKSAPEDYMKVESAWGASKPASIMIYPILFESEVLGVVELASFEETTSLQEQLMSQLSQSLGIILNNITGRLRVEQLLRESQAMTEELQVQSEELQTQQEELRRTNENLEEQTNALKRSEDLLQRQQEELEHYNTELVAKTRALEEQVQEVEEKNDEIEKARMQLEQQAKQLSITTKYKSEFMANMSHELRTPLNSLLILSQLLSENKDGNLSSKQIEYAQTIYMSGSDLLKMIDEILDLSKVDAGKMEINYEDVQLPDIEAFVEQNFAAVASRKHINLGVRIEEDIPQSIVTDSHRVKQILRNLLSNAFKFTNSGSVELHVEKADKDKLPVYLNAESDYVAFAVKDTGIGIPADKTDLIFEAFQQVDGTTSRKYGGTGLGLSISRELSRLLGGGITVESEEGKGSCFTLFLPASHPEVADGAKEAAAAMEAPPESALIVPKAKMVTKEVQPAVQIDDDRNQLGPTDKVLLIIEDDVKFARILLDMARGRGFKALVALQGDIGLEMAKSYRPDAIILDIQLPVIDGWSVMGELKSSAVTRHIPVHVISVVDEVKQGLMMGAIAYLKKPSSREALEDAFTHIQSYAEKSMKHLLIVEDDDIQRNSIIELIGHDDVSITAASTGADALRELRKQRYDCMVLDLMLTDMTGFELLDQIRDDENLVDLPIIIYTGKDLDSKEEMQLRKYAESIIIKDVKSPERLLDETTLFLHRVEADLPEDKRKILQKLHNKEELFEGKKILLVDDDIRNVFALSSVLEGYNMEVTFAENGREAIELLQENPDFDLVLMDMMMPEMDGYEAMRRLREMPEFDKLPIIALTAKAMKEDRAKCIEAGASDYMKKPIQTEQLLSLMRVWLYS